MRLLQVQARLWLYWLRTLPLRERSKAVRSFLTQFFKNVCNRCCNREITNLSMTCFLVHSSYTETNSKLPFFIVFHLKFREILKKVFYLKFCPLCRQKVLLWQHAGRVLPLRLLQVQARFRFDRIWTLSLKNMTAAIV